MGVKRIARLEVVVVDPPLIACAGLVTLDVIQTVASLPRSNQKSVAQGLFVDFGGPAANAAGVAAGLGARTTLVSALGDSPVAEAVRRYLDQAGVRVVDRAARQSVIPISSVLVEAATGLRAVVSTNASQSLVTGGIPQSTLEGVSCCLVDGHNMDLCLDLARQARDQGIPVVFDGGSWKPGTERLLPLVTHAVVSADFRPPGVDDVLAFLAGHGCVLAGRSDGGAPTRLLVDGRVHEVAVPLVEVHDTVGAGDALHGALAYAIARLGSHSAAIATAMDFATSIASLSCRAAGARGWLADTALAAEARKRAAALRINTTMPIF